MFLCRQPVDVQNSMHIAGVWLYKGVRLVC